MAAMASARLSIHFHLPHSSRCSRSLKKAAPRSAPAAGGRCCTTPSSCDLCTLRSYAKRWLQLARAPPQTRMIPSIL